MYSKKFIIIVVLSVTVLLNIAILLNNYVFNTTDQKMKSVMITQIIEHPALCAVRAGVLQALADHGYNDDSLTIDYENAQNSIVTAGQIAQKFVGLNPDLIIAISTPSAQTAVTAARNRIPVIFAAVTDPIAANLVKDLELPGVNVTGVLDRAPFEKQMQLIKQLMGPRIRLGFIYSVGEINSVVALNVFKDQAQVLGFDIIEANASKSSEVRAAAQSIIDDVDAIYIPNDNIVVSGLDSIIKVSNDHNKPVFAADIMLVKHGVIASVGVDYKHIGYSTGEIAVRVLRGEPADQIPVFSPHGNTLYINTTQANKIGLALPAGLITKADKVF